MSRATGATPETSLQNLPETARDHGYQRQVSHIVIRNLWHIYEDKIVLERINLDVAPRSFCAIAGPSGCGKSTFLRLLMAQERATRGTIDIGGTPLPAEPGPDRGVVFQRYSVFPHLTVLQNVVLGLELERAPLLGRLFGGARRRAEDEAMHYLDCVGLAGARQQHPHALSGGMRQRLSLAQALIRKPKVLLLDEPFGALDPGTKSAIHDLVLRLWEETGMTVFLVTHDLSEGFFLGTRLLVFDKVRHDPHEPDRYGATLTYDLPIARGLSRTGEIADLSASVSGARPETAAGAPMRTLHAAVV